MGQFTPKSEFYLAVKLLVKRLKKYFPQSEHLSGPVEWKSVLLGLSPEEFVSESKLRTYQFVRLHQNLGQLLSDNSENGLEWFLNRFESLRKTSFSLSQVANQISKTINLPLHFSIAWDRLLAFEWSSNLSCRIKTKEGIIDECSFSYFANPLDQKLLSELLDAAKMGKSTVPKPIELTLTQEAVLQIIKSQPKGIGIQGKAIISALKAKQIEISESTLRKHVLKILKEKYGVVNHPSKGGYFIDN